MFVEMASREGRKLADGPGHIALLSFYDMSVVTPQSYRAENVIVMYSDIRAEIRSP